MIVKTWIYMFESGDFTRRGTMYLYDFWSDWFCKDTVLPIRLKALGNVVKLVTNDYILSNYKLLFKNNSTSYDDICFDPIDAALEKKELFGVDCEDTRNGFKYCLWTARNNHDYEFSTNDLLELISYIDNLGEEFDARHKAIEDAEKEVERKLYESLGIAYTE